MKSLICLSIVIISIMVVSGCIGQSHSATVDLNPNDSANYEYDVLPPAGLILNVLNEGIYNITITTEKSGEDVVLFEQANYEYTTSDKFGVITYNKYYADKDFSATFLYGKPICESNSQHDCRIIYETPNMDKSLNVSSREINLKVSGNGHGNIVIMRVL